MVNIAHLFGALLTIQPLDKPKSLGRHENIDATVSVAILLNVGWRPASTVVGGAGSGPSAAVGGVRRC